jgi:uncharacterized membrane protein YgcG
VRVSALKCVAAILPLLDETTVVSAVLPTLRRVRDQDHTPAVVMCSLGCYELIAKRLLPSALARHLLPGYARTAHVRAELEGKRGGVRLLIFACRVSVPVSRCPCHKNAPALCVCLCCVRPLASRLIPLLDEKALNLKQFEMVASRVTAVTAQVIAARRHELGQYDDAGAAAQAAAAVQGVAGSNAFGDLSGNGGGGSGGSGGSSSWNAAPAASGVAAAALAPPHAASAPAAADWAVPAPAAAKTTFSAAGGAGDWSGAFGGTAAAQAPPLLPLRNAAATPEPPASTGSGFGDGGRSYGSSKSSSFGGGFGGSGGGADDDPFASICDKESACGSNGSGLSESGSGGFGSCSPTAGSMAAAGSSSLGVGSMGSLGVGFTRTGSGFGDGGDSFGVSSRSSSSSSSSSGGGSDDFSGYSGMGSGFSGFGGPSAASPPPFAAAPTAGGFGGFGAMSSGLPRSGSGGMGGGLLTPGASAGFPAPPQPSFGVGLGGCGGLSVEQQMAETQRQIALLQSQLGQGAPPGPPTVQPQRGGSMGGSSASGNINIGNAFDFI